MRKRRDTAIGMAIPELTGDFWLSMFLDPDGNVIEALSMPETRMKNSL